MEREIILFFHINLSHPFFDALMSFITNNGWWLFIPIILIVPFTLSNDKNHRVLIYFFASIVIAISLSDWISLLIKNLTMRERPCWSIEFREIVGCTASYSFPSSHASDTFALTSVLFLFLRNYLVNITLRNFIFIFLLIISLLICLSRVYLGVHWLSDVIVGGFLGTLLGYLSYRVILQVKDLKSFFYFFLILLSLFRFYLILQGPLDLSPDEAHYWEWSRRLDLSYYSKGPMIAYLIALSTAIFGDNPFGVRVFAVLCSFLSSIFIFMIGKKLFNEKVGYFSGILFQFIPLFSVYGIGFSIDSPFILFWVLSIYLLITALEGKKSYWILLGFSIGFGLLTKYTMVFFYVCMIIYLVMENSKVSINNLKNPMLYTSILISLLVFSPVIIWNFNNDWVTLKHTAGQANIQEGLKVSLRYLGEFIGSQLLAVNPLFFLIGLYLILKPSVLNIKTSTRWFMLSFSLPVLIFFFLKSIQGKVQANWAMTAYVPFLFIIAYSFEKDVYKKLIKATLITALIFTILIHLVIFLNLPSNIDPTSRLKGWRQLGLMVYEIKKDLEEQGHVIIFSDRYQISSELAFYVKDNPLVYCINLGRRMNQYDLWQSINSEIRDGRIVNGIYVVYGKRDQPEREVLSAFDYCMPEYFTSERKGVKIRDYTIFRCYNFKGMTLRKPEIY